MNSFFVLAARLAPRSARAPRCACGLVRDGMPPATRSASKRASSSRSSPLPAKSARKGSATKSGFRVPYVLDTSPIAGRGVFAVKRIRRGTLIWQYVVGESVLEHDEASMRSRLCDLSKQAAADLLEHVYVWEGAVIEILDDAKVWNHSAEPNTGNHPDEALGAGDGMSSYALRDIEPGEELTDDYALHDDLPWFEKLCAAHKATSCTSLGKSSRG